LGAPWTPNPLVSEQHPGQGGVLRIIVVASAPRARIIAPRASAIVKTAAGLLMLCSLDIVLNAPIGFIVAARVKLTIERGR
jgi:hypothetical protein